MGKRASWGGTVDKYMMRGWVWMWGLIYGKIVQYIGKGHLPR